MIRRQTRIPKIGRAASVLTALAAALLASCDGPLPVLVESDQHPIYHGYDYSTNPITGVVKTKAPHMGCSGMVYNKHWVITAAHCFKSSSDPNNDGVITRAEAAADDPDAAFEIQQAMTSAGTLAAMPIQATFRQPPGTTWGDSAVPDFALARLDATLPGVHVPNLYSGFYLNGQLRVYQGSVRSWPQLPYRKAIGYGYGPTDSSGAGKGLLHAAWKRIAVYPESFFYGGITYNDAGPSCPGDSGGPDMYEVGTDDWQQIGIHNSANNLNCTGSQDSNLSSEYWRDWVYAMARPNREMTKWRDIDLDGLDDLVFFRQSTAYWQVECSGPCSNFAGTFGLGGDIPVPADYDGDARTDRATYRPTTGWWSVRRSSDGGESNLVFGGYAGDTPVPGDYDGDSMTNFAICRSNGSYLTWFWYPGNQGGLMFGSSGDKPVTGDYDGDGKTDYAVFRPSTATWYWWPGNQGGTNFGLPTDAPIPADYDGDGKTDYALYRASDASWYVRPSGGGADWGAVFGQAGKGDKPVPRDYDGDRKADFAYTRYEWVTSGGGFGSEQGYRVTLNVKLSKDGAVVKTVVNRLVASSDLTP